MRKNKGGDGAVAYVRVSSKAQSLSMQRDAIERAATARGDAIRYWYEEKASGRTIERPELRRLRNDACAGLVGRLYLYRVDRLTRSGIRDTLEVVQELRAVGTTIVTVADGFALDGPTADVIIAMMAWASQMERLAINERIAAARVRMEAAGQGWGRPTSHDEAQRARVCDLKGAGGTIRGIAAEVGLSRSAVARILSRKDAAGLACNPDGERDADALAR